MIVYKCEQEVENSSLTADIEAAKQEQKKYEEEERSKKEENKQQQTFHK